MFHVIECACASAQTGQRSRDGRKSCAARAFCDSVVGETCVSVSSPVLVDKGDSCQFFIEGRRSCHVTLDKVRYFFTTSAKVY